ncbi:MAG: hypothetical protein AB7P08_11490 [Burkholderiales bacterium]
MSESMSATQFRNALRHVIHFRQQAPVADPLASAVERIGRNPAFAQARLLIRILVALTHDRGEFRRAELGALDAETYALVIGLMDSFEAGTYERAQWDTAVESAQAAEMGACG